MERDVSYSLSQLVSCSSLYSNLWIIIVAVQKVTSLYSNFIIHLYQCLNAHFKVLHYFDGIIYLSRGVFCVFCMLYCFLQFALCKHTIASALLKWIHVNKTAEFEKSNQNDSFRRQILNNLTSERLWSFIFV